MTPYALSCHIDIEWVFLLENGTRGNIDDKTFIARDKEAYFYLDNRPRP
jgi:hypothetical protein